MDNTITGFAHLDKIADEIGDEAGTCDADYAFQKAAALMIYNLRTALEAAEAESDRLRLKCGEAAPEGTEIYHVGSTEFVLCPSCDYEFEDPWDEPELDADADGWHGVIVCRNCSARIEVHSQSTHFWTAKLADEEAARRAVAESEVGE